MVIKTYDDKNSLGQAAAEQAATSLRKALHDAGRARIINVNDDKASLGRAAANKLQLLSSRQYKSAAGTYRCRNRRLAQKPFPNGPKRERGLATALFDSGSSIGGPLLGCFWLMV